jgi:hypothetical protein
VFPPEAVRVAVDPAQIIASLGVVPEPSVTEIDTIGLGFTVTLVETVVTQPEGSVTVTVYVPAVPALMLLVVLEDTLLHK